jgi:hypothetical protein
MERMATENLPTPTLQSVTDEPKLIAVIDNGASCCGADGCCSLD